MGIDKLPFGHVWLSSKISEAYSIVIARIATSSPRTILFCIPSEPHPKQISVETNIIGWSTDPKALRLTKRS